MFQQRRGLAGRIQESERQMLAAGKLQTSAADNSVGRVEQIVHEARKRTQQKLQEDFAPDRMLNIRSPEYRAKARTICIQCFDEMGADFPRPTILQFAEKIIDELLGYGPLEPLFADPEITEIIVERWDRIYVQKGGLEELTDIAFRDEQHCRDVLDRMLASTGRKIDMAEPVASARLPDGSRLMALIAPVGVEGTNFAVRRFRRGLTAEDLIRFRMFNEETMYFLSQCVKGALNTVCSGGTASGKTTVLNVLAAFIPHDESLITIEDPAELQLNHPHVRRWEAKPKNVEGKGEITQADLVAIALRSTPKRIIVGECRKGEAFAMLQAMNTGHEGSMTTVHANSGEEALNSRLVNMVLMSDEGRGLPYEAIIGQIASSVDVVVHITRDRTGRRRLDHILEVLGTEVVDGRLIVKTQRLYEYDQEKDTWGRKAGFFAHAEKLYWKGIRIPGWVE